MEKIQIQFNESDYNTYYDYCLKYYQVHDTARRQAIHAFLELYSKGILVVEEQDIRPARRFLAAKCTGLQPETGTSSGEDMAAALRFRLCNDLLSFLEDLEKIYRLIKKQGSIPNYLMLLATFSKVIDESRDAAAAGLYDIDRSLIEALATPLAEIIRKRLGADRQWQSVIKELSFIATRFGQKFPEPVFDGEIVQLVAPSVVAHFNRDAGRKEILSALTASYEECELEEFEALLNRTPEALRYDQETDIDWDAIARPLGNLAAEVNSQRQRLARESSSIADPSLLMTPDHGGGFRPDVPAGPSRDVVSSPGGKSFDIAVTPDGTTHVESPIREYPGTGEPAKSPGFAAFRPYMSIIIGFLIIVAFIAGTMFISGGLGAQNTTNTTTKIPVNVTKTVTAAKPVATTAAPKATTVKPAVTTVPTPKAYTASEIGNHLLDIAFGPNNNNIVKPNKSLVSVSISGAYSDDDVDHVMNFIDDFNLYSTTTKLSTNLNIQGQGDIPVVLIPEEALLQIDTSSRTEEFRDTDSGKYYAIITNEKVYLNSDLSGVARKKWMIRGILDKLGLYGETLKYSDSIFYSNTNSAVEPSTIDWKALQLIFGKKITVGMTKSQVKTLLGL